MTTEERFWEKVARAGEGECWEWLSAKHPKGHGLFWIGGVDWRGGRSRIAHRISFLLAGGEIPEGHVVHHVCENPGCVNPRHLQPLVLADHTRLHLRGRSGTKATACNRGHRYPENARMTSSGHQTCRRCDRDRKRIVRAVGKD